MASPKSPFSRPTEILNLNEISPCRIETADGFANALEALATLRLSATLVSGSIPGGGRIFVVDGAVRAAQCPGMAGMQALVKLARHGGCFFLEQPVHEVPDELGLLPPVLVAHIRHILEGAAPAPIQRAMDPVGAPIPNVDDSPESLLDSAKLVVRSRRDSEDGRAGGDDQFPDDFLSELVPNEFRGEGGDTGGSADPNSWVDPSIGYMLGKCYLSAEIGRGATAIVYRAMHLSLKVDVAVKIFLPGPEGFNLNHREAHILARLNHPNVLRVLDCSEDPPYPHLVMEYVDGSTLQDLIGKTGRLQPTMALNFLRMALAGLSHAQEQGVTHCDIKPGNFLISRNNDLKVADLGIAQMQVEEHAITATSAAEAARAVVGTPAYIAPEVVENGLLAADWRSDLYSLGATFYHALTGRPPFLGSDPIELMVKQVKELPPSPREFAPDLTPDLEALILQMLDKDPTRRGESYEAIMDEVERILEQPTGLNYTVNPQGNPIYLTINQAWRTMRRTLDRVLGG